MVSCVEIYLISTMYSCLGLSSSDHSFMSELILAISLTDSDRLASPFSFSPSDSSERSSAASLRPCSRSNRLFASLCASSHAICEYIILHSLSWYNAKKEKSHYRIAPSRLQPQSIHSDRCKPKIWIAIFITNISFRYILQ
jgi:hypothetical protein